MGSPVAQNLINAGCDVAVWNRTESKCNPPLSRWVQRSLMSLWNTCSTETTCQSCDDAYEKPGVTEITIVEQNAGNQQELVDRTTLKY